MSETPDDDAKVVRWPVSVRPELQGGRVPDSDAQELRQQILELLEEVEADAPPLARTTAEPEWLPAPKPSEVVLPPQPDVPQPHHRNAIVCPQCDRWTWRATDECRLCGYNLARHFEWEEEVRVAQRQERDRRARARLRTSMAQWALGLLVISALLLGNAAKAPPGLRSVLFYGGLLAFVAAILVAKLIPE